MRSEMREQWFGLLLFKAAMRARERNDELAQCAARGEHLPARSKSGAR